MKIYYRLTVLRAYAEALLPKWRNQGWEPTIVSVLTDTCIVTLDMVTDKNTDPTQYRGVVFVAP